MQGDAQHRLASVDSRELVLETMQRLHDQDRDFSHAVQAVVPRIATRHALGQVQSKPKALLRKQARCSGYSPTSMFTKSHATYRFLLVQAQLLVWLASAPVDQRFSRDTVHQLHIVQLAVILVAQPLPCKHQGEPQNAGAADEL